MSRKPGSIVRGISTPRRISASQRAGCRWRVSTADGAKGQGIARQDGRARLLTVTTEPIRIKGLSGPDEPRFELRTGPPLIIVVGSGWQEWQGSNLRPPVLETGALPIELHSFTASPRVRVAFKHRERPDCKGEAQASRLFTPRLQPDRKRRGLAAAPPDEVGTFKCETDWGTVPGVTMLAARRGQVGWPSTRSANPE